jgi:hypothetical protein
MEITKAKEQSKNKESRLLSSQTQCLCPKPYHDLAWEAFPSVRGEINNLINLIEIRPVFCLSIFASQASIL